MELEALGRDVAADGERAWGLGVVFAELGESGRSLRYLRRALGPAVEAGAPGLPARLWQLYYPLGYGEHVRTAARAVSLDPYVVAAVIREESSYDPRARSGVGRGRPDAAHARHRARRRAGTRAAPGRHLGALWDPPVNITLGSRYLAQLSHALPGPPLRRRRVQRWPAPRPAVDRGAPPGRHGRVRGPDPVRRDARLREAGLHELAPLPARCYGETAAPGRRGEAVAAPRPGP